MLIYAGFFLSKDMQSLPLQFLSGFYGWMRDVLKRMKNKFSYFYFSSYNWLYLQFYGDTSDFSSVSPTKKKDRSKVVKLTGQVWNEQQRMKNQFSDF